MKTRKEFLDNLNQPFLPDNCFSIKQFHHLLINPDSDDKPGSDDEESSHQLQEEESKASKKLEPYKVLPSTNQKLKHSNKSSANQALSNSKTQVQNKKNEETIKTLIGAEQKLKNFWVGGKICSKVSEKRFKITSHTDKTINFSNTVTCFLTKDTSLIFSLKSEKNPSHQQKQESMSWKQAFPLLKQGDHVLVHVQSLDAGVRYSFSKGETVKKGVLKDNFQVEEDSEVEPIKVVSDPNQKKTKKQEEAEEAEEDGLRFSTHTLDFDMAVETKKILLISTRKKAPKGLKKSPSVTGSKNRDPRDLEKKLLIHHEWFNFLMYVERAMSKMGMQKVETPTLVQGLGTEGDLNLFETMFYPAAGDNLLNVPSAKGPINLFKNQPQGSHKKNPKSDHYQENSKPVKLFLSSSPEMQIKRLLCRGLTDIYEIKKCFRNSEKGSINSCEFYILEWYRSYSNLDSIIKDLRVLLSFLWQKADQHPCSFLNPWDVEQRRGFDTFFARQDKDFDTTKLIDIKKQSVKSLFKQYLNINLKPTSSKKDFIPYLKKKNIPFSDKATASDLFYLLFLNGIEPYLDEDTPLIVYDYPPFQKAYSRIGQNGFSLRFELFWKGMELANAFDEVTIKKEQAQRFEEEKLMRQKKGLPEVAFSKALLQDMERGTMPPQLGVPWV